MFDEQPTLPLLFDQLGLDSDEVSIEKFVAEHQLEKDILMHQADFWSEGQSQFLKDHWQKDDDWAIVVDTLNELLSQNQQK